MIPISSALRALLSGTNRIWTCDLYSITLLTGQVLRYNSTDIDVPWSGNTWLGTKPGLVMERSKMKQTVGVSVDQLQVDCYPSDDVVIGSNRFLDLAINGGLDGAILQLDRAYAPDLAATGVPVITGIIPKRFYGRIGELTASASKVTMMVKSDLELLNVQMPRVVYQPPCSHSLYDAGCTLAKSAFTSSGTITASSSLTNFTTSGLTAANGYYNLGVLIFETGPNAGLSRYIQTYQLSAGAIKILFPLPVDPQPGDTFTIYPGCDKTFAMCSSSKFSNDQNFRGFEFVPNPETALV